MLRHPCTFSSLLLRPSLLRPAVLTILLAGFVNLAAPAQITTPPPRSNIAEAFRQFLRSDMDALGKLVKLKNDTAKMIDGKPENKDKNAYYQKVVDSLTPRIKEQMEASKTRLAYLRQNMASLADYADVLRLDDWEALQSELREGLYQVDPALHEELAAEMTKKVQELAKTGSPEDKAALCILLGDDANYARAQKTFGAFYLTKLRAMIPVVVTLSKQESPKDRPVRKGAAIALAEMQASPADQIAAFENIKKVDGEDIESRRTAYRALAMPFSTASPRSLALKPVYAQFTATDQIAYREETKGLIENHASLVLPKFAEGLQDPDPTIRQISIDAYRDIASIMLVPLDPAPDVNKDAPVDYELRLKPMYDLIRGIQPLIDELTKHSPALIAAAADPDRNVRLQALAILGDLAEVRNRVRGWRAQLERATKQPQGAMRRDDGGLRAADFTATAAPQDDLSTPASDKLSPALREALKVINLDLSSPDRGTRLAAIEVLDGMNPDHEILEIVDIAKALRDEYVWVRRTAIRILNRLGPVQPETVIPALIPMIRNDQDSDLAKPLALLLSKYGPKATPAVPALMKAVLGAGEQDTRIAFLQTLAAIGPDAKEAIPAIAHLLEPIDAFLKCCRRRAGRLPSSHPRRLEYDNVFVRAAAADTLGRFGPLAKGAGPALEAALDDQDPQLRKAASEALLRIRGK